MSSAFCTVRSSGHDGRLPPVDTLVLSCSTRRWFDCAIADEARDFSALDWKFSCPARIVRNHVARMQMIE
jgi:hypothetical protein